MVFAVNPGPDYSSNSFAAFLEEALEIGAELASNHTPVTHQINVSNNTAGLIFDPPYIVRQSIIMFGCCADISSLLERRSWRHRRIHLPPQEPQCDPIQLCRTLHALAWRIRHWLVRHYSLTSRVFFLNASLRIASPLHSVLAAAASPREN